jgi:hypothetical protein
MTLDQIADRNADFTLNRIWKPDTWPWEKLFTKPRSYRASIPSLGVEIWDFDEEKPVTMINFEVASLPEIRLRSRTNELTFRRGQNVSRAQVTRMFGEPTRRLNQLKEVTPLINRGESISFTNEVSEHLFFSSHGVFFVIRNGELQTVTIVKKFGGTNAASPP